VLTCPAEKNAGGWPTFAGLMYAKVGRGECSRVTDFFCVQL
jgi:hypothetical protein